MIKCISHVLTNETPLPYRQDKPPCTPQLPKRSGTYQKLAGAVSRLAFAHDGATGAALASDS
jgi:hypothetical protein